MRILAICTTFPFLLWWPQVEAFAPVASRPCRETIAKVSSSLGAATSNKKNSIDPQVLASGFSQSMDLQQAIREAMDMALGSLPQPTKKSSKIDLAVVSVSSLYDGSASPSLVVPAVVEAASGYGQGIQHLVGSTNGGYITSNRNPDFTHGLHCLTTNSSDSEEEEDEEEEEEDDASHVRACFPRELEGVPGVSITLCLLPDVELQTFHVLGDDVPDDYGRLSPNDWKQAVGLPGFLDTYDDDSEKEETKDAVIMLLPSPAFQKDLDDLLRGFETNLPGATLFGAIASTVSSLSRARMFRYESGKDHIQTLGDGCVGVAMTGDILVQTMIAQGAKPVGGVYQIVKGKESTILTIALDEAATELIQMAESQENEQEVEEEEEEVDESNTKAILAQAYAKARIPKPVLAEANFLMKTLSDDDQAFMRKALLVGLERNGSSMARTPSELARLAEGRGHRFTVHQVASAAMKDGSITLSLGSVNVQPGTRMRFYVRESDFAKKEVSALWTGYKKRELTKSVSQSGGTTTFSPTGCFLFPTLDRGNKFFLGKPGFESGAVSDCLPTVPCISGFYANGIIGSLQTDPEVKAAEPASVYGSASGYVLFGSKSNRPHHSSSQAAAEETAQKSADEKQREEEDKRDKKLSVLTALDKKAPRNENGELIYKRREIHSGRALTVSTVEWSVAEKTATPTSTLEGFMWDKETEVDRFRERVPLANLLSQCKLYNMDPEKPNPRDWVKPVKEAVASGRFVILPECKRTEPSVGSLRKRYDVTKLVNEFVQMGVPAFSVNCDGVLFGGTLEDLTKARDAATQAALEAEGSDDGVVVPPVMASDLLLYPYQIYKIRLAGADAVNLIVGALESKDLLYLTKIASSLNMQSMLTVTSVYQLKNAIQYLAAGSIGGVIVSNRQLEDFSFDMTGQQVLEILKSDEMKDFRKKFGDDALVLVEGRVGLIPSQSDGTILGYVQELQDAGAMGAIVGGGMVPNSDTKKSPLESLLSFETQTSS